MFTVVLGACVIIPATLNYTMLRIAGAGASVGRKKAWTKCAATWSGSELPSMQRTDVLTAVRQQIGTNCRPPLPVIRRRYR
jgi:hypothetical protein